MSDTQESKENSTGSGNRVTIEVQELTYGVIVGSAKKPKRLLKNVNLSFTAPSMVALMGPSGAGKSTLLDVLADRKLDGMWSGDIIVDGKPRSDEFRLRTAYVLQDDLHIATLTVAEILYYSAWTRMPANTPPLQLQARVDQLLNIMGIDHIRNSIVGDSMRKGISGGQLKRLSIAVELVNLPDVIFLDEPTSGLDSSISLEVMAAVKQLATDGSKLCISTIHQPSPEVYQLFDQLVLMCAGRLVYFGGAMDALQYFTSPALGYRYLRGTNPAEFVIAVGGGSQCPEGSSSKKPRQPEELEALYKSSRYYNPPALASRQPSDREQRQQQQEGGQSAEDLVKEQRTTFLIQLQMLVSRTWKAKLRDTDDLRAQLFKNLVVGLLIGIVFYGQGKASTPLFDSNGVPNSSVTNVSSLLYFSLMYTMVGNLQAIPYIASQQVMYRRELAAGAYLPTPFWLSQLVTILPLQVVYHSIFVIMLYFLVGFPTSASYFFYYWFTLLLANITAFYSAIWLAAATQSETVAFALFPVLFLWLANMAGFAIAVDNIPPIWHWSTYLSYARWYWEGLMVNEWTRFNDNANDDYNNGENVLSNYGFTNFDKNTSLWIACLYILGFAGMTWLALQPPRKNLKRVANLAEMTTTAAVSILEMGRKSSLSPWASDVLRESILGDTNGAGSGKNKRGQRYDIDDDDDDDDDKAEEIKVQLEYSVDFYRQSSGFVDKVDGCLLTFNNVSYTVSNKQDKNEKILLLNKVTGMVRPGEMCALMGASGAGKSTLLDVLAGRKNTGEIVGEILYNHSPKLISSAYVMQDNVHVGLLTVRENLYFAAQLRLPESWSLAKKRRQVEKILDMLALKLVANSVVGTATIRGISGGQLKRLSIGVEIVALPNVIYLDEPTTGLDSSISFEVMAAVRNLANQNRSVVATIHQPSQQTFDLFDTLLLLAKGRVIYFGPVAECVSYFVQGHYAFPYRANSNVADYVVAVAGGFIASPAPSGAAGEAPKDRIVSGEELADYYEQQQVLKQQQQRTQQTLGNVYSTSNSPLQPRNESFNSSAQLSRQKSEQEIDAEQQLQLDYQAFNTSTSHQLKTLLHRNVMKTSRDRRATVVATIRHVIVALFYGSLYFQLSGGTSSTAYSNRLGLFFFTLMFFIIGHQQSIPALLEDRLIFYRERGAKAYGALSYWCSLWTVQLPLVMTNSLLYSLILFYMVGLRNDKYSFGYFYFFLVTTSCCGYFIANTMAAISPSTQAALSFYPVALFVSVSFAGFLVYIPRFPDWLGSWAPYISFMRYSFQGLTLNEFNSNNNLPYGPEEIGALGFESPTIGTCAGVMIVWIVFYAAVFLSALRFINFEQR